MFRFAAAPPLALYIHLPWCLNKCPYCDFNSHALRTALPERDYVQALIADLERDLPLVWGRRIESVFIGGGTPSLFSAEIIDELLAAIRARLPCRPEAEVTLEANPGALDAAGLGAFRAAGVTRLSLGVQSFNDDMLQRLGRIHRAEQAVAAAEAALRTGFNSVNLDLMYGLPGQTTAEAIADVEQALRLGPQHVSHYQLTLEPNTPFYRDPPPLPPDSETWRMQTHCQSRLAAGGYAQYEVSAYARSGHTCAHNLNYWRFGDYLGIGAGAHAKLTDASRRRITRLWKTKHPQAYMHAAQTGAAVVAGSRELSPEDAVFEFLMNALRLNEGFDAALFTAHTGLPFEAAAAGLEQARARGLIEVEDKCVRPSALGRRFLDDLLTLFVPEPAGTRSA